MPFELGIEHPHAALPFLGESQAFERLEPAHAHSVPTRILLVVGGGIASTLSLACASSERSSRVRRSCPTSLTNFLRRSRSRLGTELQGNQLLHAAANAVADVLPRQDQVLAALVAPAQHDMRVRMAGIEVIDGDPVELDAQILFHLAHEIADHRLQLGQAVAVLGGDDEAELVRVAVGAIQERLAVRWSPASL